MPYCFLGLFIKFQGHTGWKIDDLNPIWVRLLGRSQLSNPSDLPCFIVAFFLSCDQAALWMVQSVCLSVCLWCLFDYVPIIMSAWNSQELLPMTKVMSIRAGVKYVFVFANTNTNTNTVYLYLYLIKFQTMYLYLYLIHRIWCIWQIHFQIHFFLGHFLNTNLWKTNLYEYSL